MGEEGPTTAADGGVRPLAERRGLRRQEALAAGLLAEPGLKSRAEASARHLLGALRLCFTRSKVGPGDLPVPFRP
jgi:hypothetical protein